MTDTVTFSRDFERALAFTLQWEGGKADVPGDRGGRTNMGVTQRAYSAWLAASGQPDRDVFLMDALEAKVIYWRNYWQPAAEGHAWPLSAVLFDVAVNHGPGRARTWLYLARAGTTSRTPDLAGVLARRILGFRRAFFKALALQPRQRQFLKGWLRRTDALAQFIAYTPA